MPRRKLTSSGRLEPIFVCPVVVVVVGARLVSKCDNHKRATQAKHLASQLCSVDSAGPFLSLKRVRAAGADASENGAQVAAALRWMDGWMHGWMDARWDGRQGKR